MMSVTAYIRAGFAFSGLELRLMTLSKEYREFVGQKVNCVDDSTECRFRVPIALAIPMAALRLPR
jgi:hypothetical protein